MSIISEEWGSVSDGRRVYLYTLSSPSLTVKVSSFGAVIVGVLVKDKDGVERDVMLGFDSLEGYRSDHPCFGSPIGRCANRVKGASAVIDGKEYLFEKNEGENLLHSGRDPWFKRLWDAEVLDDGVRFTLVSPDGDQGMPGRAEVSITYSLTPDGGLAIDYDAVSDKATIFNITNHSYFNLNGAGSVLGHTAVIYSDYFTPTDSEQIPTGELVPVEGTPFDFRTEKALGKDIDADHPQIRLAGGYDHNYVLDNGGKCALAARLRGDKSGIVMEVYTDMPGVQMYTSNNLHSQPGKGGAVHEARSSVCFETQFFPDAVHHDNFKQPVFAAGQHMKSRTVYRFFAE